MAWEPPEASGWTPPEATNFVPSESKEKGLLDKAGDVITDTAEKLTTGVNLKKILEKPVEAVTTFPGFTRDASKEGQVPYKEQLKEANKAGITGAEIGGGLGAVGLAPGIATGAASGYSMGFLGGLAEQTAKNLGYKEDFQTLSNLMVGGLAPGKTVDLITKNRLAHDAIQRAEGFVMDNLPKVGLIRKMGQLGEKLTGASEPRIPTKDIESAIGTEAKTAGVKLPTDPTGEVFKFNQQLQKETQASKVGDLYEDAKSKFDQAISQYKPEDINNIISHAENNVPKSSVNRIKNLFVDADHNPYSGDVVVNNLKYDNPDFAKLTQNEQELAKKTFNDLTESKGLGRPEENARNWSQKEFVARAKDELPEKFKSLDYKTINNQMQNYGKSPEGSNAFLQEMGHSMKNLTPDQVRTMWQNIGQQVNKFIVKDPQEFKKINDMVNEVKDKKSLNKLSSNLIRLGYGTYEVRQKVKKGEL